jgi:uncharacterized repeat protein (TIGR03803 family)
LAVGSDGNLYGTTSGAFVGAGNVFRATLSGGVTILHEFGFLDGVHPFGNLLLANDGNFCSSTFGEWDVTNPFPGRQYFSYDRRWRSVAPARLLSRTWERHVAHASERRQPVRHRSERRRSRGRIVFMATLPAILHDFGFDDGSNPTGNSLRAGTAVSTGRPTSDPAANGFGTVFKMSASGTITTLHRFVWLDGRARPRA